MKFGEVLLRAQVPEWKFYYIDYKALKVLLKVNSTDNFSDPDEANFVRSLEEEIHKVSDFVNIKAGELTRHVQDLEGRVKANLASEKELRVEEDLRTASGAAADEAMLSKKKKREESATVLEEEIGSVSNELMNLAKFVRMNYTACIKILKKHDKRTSFILKPMFLARLDYSNPFFKESFDVLILRLSKLYDNLRTNNVSRSSHSNQSGNFVRRTTKYWVHPDNVTELKLRILKQLPVLVFDGKDRPGNSAGYDPAISSVYFDNQELELYHGRVEKNEGAVALRLRWYGSQGPQEVFVERKTHREDWTGETSVKSRFSIMEKFVNDYLAGKWSTADKFARMREKGTFKPSVVDEMETLSKEVQELVLAKKLRPMVRTFYNRTAFQLPNDARVRISLDTELTMVLEEGHTNGNWYRRDVNVEYPFAHLPAGQVNRFPYAVLEVKLQTQVGQEPSWILNLLESNLVEEVPKFSKFIHGCATLLEPRVRLYPFWLHQMDKDIRGPAPFDPSRLLNAADDAPAAPAAAGVGAGAADTGAGAAKEKGKEKAKTSINMLPDLNPSKLETLDSLRTPSSPVMSAASNGEVRIDVDGKGGAGVARDPIRAAEEMEKVPLLYGSINDTDALLPQSNRRTNGNASYNNGKGRSNNNSRFSLGVNNCFSWIRRDGISGWRTKTKAGKDKKIFLPVRVEPKVFFANERTFLSYLHFAIVLSTIAVGLVSFGNGPARVSGFVFIGTVLVIIVYSLIKYLHRAHMIRNKDPGPYDDRFGPVVIACLLIAAMIFNVIYTALSLSDE